MIAGVVLAGGRSSRMGCDKSQLKLNGVTLIQRSQHTLKQSGVAYTCISGKLGTPDLISDKGPIAGVSACLESLKKYQYVLFTAVDMPLLNKSIFKHLITHKNNTAIHIERNFFPLIIHNTPANRTLIQQQLAANILSIRNMLKSIHAVAIKNYFPDSLFSNANSQEQWNEVLKNFKSIKD